MPEKQEKKSILEQQETDPDQDYPGSDFELDIIHLYLAEDFSDLEGEVDSPPEEINSAFPEVNALGYPDQSNQFETPALPNKTPSENSICLITKRKNILTTTSLTPKSQTLKTNSLFPSRHPLR